MTLISEQVLDLFNPGQLRDAHGRWVAHPTAAQWAVIDAEKKKKRIAEPITPSEARGNSRPVSPEEFQRLAADGRSGLREMRRNRGPLTGLDRGWPKIKSDTYRKVQDSWGGATIDPHTGQALPDGADKYALSVKPAGLHTVSIPENASEQDFNDAMDRALAQFRSHLEPQSSYLGVFHDDDNNRIDIDPVTVVDTPEQVEQIGAYTHAIGGAYHFKTGDGFFPPHVAAAEVSMANTEDVHWKGPGHWRSAADAAQPGLTAAQLAELDAEDGGEAAPSIAGQVLGSGTGLSLISDQVLDMASIHGHHVKGTPDTYRHGWKPISGQAGTGIDNPRTLRTARRSRQYLEQQQAAEKAARQAADDAEKERLANNKIITHAAVQAAQTRVQEAKNNREIVADHAEDMSRMLAQIRSMQQQLNDLEDKKETKAGRLRLATHIGVAAAGAVLAAVEAKMGTPDLVTIASSIGPIALQELVDWKKRL